MVHSSPFRQPLLADHAVHLTLLVPELIWPEPADQFTLGKLTAPGLQWLVARAQLQRQPAQPFESVLARQFGFNEASANETPFGPLRLLGDGHAAAEQGHWLCADPVHLRFHQERIVLADAGAFDLDIDEATALTQALNQAFADIGEFHVADARHWYLRLHQPIAHPVQPLSAMAGRRIDGELTGNALPLTRWLNEVQMFLHGHPINEQRQATGKPAINSLWLWGGGTLENREENRGQTTVSPVTPIFSAVFSDNPLARGLAQTCGIPLHGRPAMLAAALPAAGPRPLVVLDQLLPRVLYEDGDGWRSAFEQLENDWFAPLQQALGKPIKQLSLIAPTIYGNLQYTVSAGQRWKFWKSAPPIQAMAETLAGKEPA